MRKEQILLVAAIAIGALLVWGATGKYTEVGAKTLPDGKSVSVVPSRKATVGEGLGGALNIKRSIWAIKRSETRPPLPDLPVPDPLPLPWVRPVTRPGPSADHWQKLRMASMPVVAKPKEPEKAEDGAAAPAQPADNDPGGAQPGGAQPGGAQPQILDKAKLFKASKAARLVPKVGDEIIVWLEPSQEFKGQPDWVILEKWPNVKFKWSRLDDKGKAVLTAEVLRPEDLESYKTVRLRWTLDNLFHQERINRGVRDNDRDALVSFAQWCFDELRGMSGEDEVPFAIGAVKKAIEVHEKAVAIQSDADLVRKLGSYYRAAFDLDGALRCYLAYLKSHQTESAAALLVGDAFERMSCWSNARALYEKAALTGDAEARLRVGLMLEREGDLARAAESLKAIAGQAGVAPRANLALARIAIRNGDFAAATSYADQAKKEPSPALNLVLGSILYVNGKFSEAATTFAAAKEDEVSSVWRSNRGLALLAAGQLDDAAKEFQACLDSDPLNLVDPLFGLGEVYQRKGEPDRSNAYYEMALARAPNDPWILLRVGTLRLRDGQAETALKMALKLTEIAPGCNEGLWLVGRAAASLEKPDWDKAVAYLRRACAKEPKNVEFLYEYARVLVLAGRIDDAIDALDEATEVKNGHARTDGRLVGVLGWARFLGKRPMDEVNRDVARAKNAVLDDTTKEWLAAVRMKLDEWDSTRIWTDDFNRQASSDVGNGWEERDAAHGITAGINKDRLVFATVPTGVKESSAEKREAATRIWRNDPALCDLTRVKEVEASIKPQAGVEMIFHIYLDGSPLVDRGTTVGGGGRGKATGAELGLGCDRNGMMVLWLVGAATKDKNQLAEYRPKDAAGNERQWPMDDFHTVRFVRKDAAKGIWEIWFDDEPIKGPDGKTTFEVAALGKTSGRRFGLGFLLDAETGSTFDTAAEYVRVTKTNK